MSFKKSKSLANGTNVEKKKSAFARALPQLIAVSIKNVLLLGYGMTLGFPTIVIPTIQGGEPRETLILSQNEVSWISSINYICVPLGCLLSGIVTQPIGRKKSMQLVNLPFLAAWLLFHFSSSVTELYLALCLTGFGGGLLEAPVITYVAEITQPHLRGMLSATSSMTIILGVFIQFLMGTFFYWRTVALINLSIPIVAILLLFIVPESPHWLVTKNRLMEARQSLAWLRGWTTLEEVDSEYRDLCLSLGKNPATGIDNPAFVSDIDSVIVRTPQQKSESKMTTIKRFGKRSFVLPYMLIAYGFFLGHFSGMTTLQTFAVQIFQTLKAPIDKYYATLLLGIVELLGSLLCVIAVHYTGKRPLTFFSTIGCGVCFIIVATYAHLIDVKYLVSGNIATNLTETNITMTDPTQTVFGISLDTLHWLPTTFLIGSAFLSHAGIRLLPWVLIGEVFPGNVRGIASGLSGGIGYIFGFTANKAFLTMINTLTLPGTFWFYGAMSLIGTVILYFALPETEGRTLIDIENHFSGIRKLTEKSHKSKNIMEIGEINLGFNGKNTFSKTDNIESRL